MTTNRPNSARRRHIRRQLAARDGAACFYCAGPFADLAQATIDHLIPHSKLPTWNQANLVLACGPCNRAKANRLPQEFLRPAGFRPGLVPSRTRRVRARLATAMSARRPATRRTARPCDRVRGRSYVRLVAALTAVAASALAGEALR